MKARVCIAAGEQGKCHRMQLHVGMAQGSRLWPISSATLPGRKTDKGRIALHWVGKSGVFACNGVLGWRRVHAPCL